MEQEVIFVCREFDGNLCDFIEKKGYIAQRLPMSNTQEHNIEDNLKHVRPGLALIGRPMQGRSRKLSKRLNFHLGNGLLLIIMPLMKDGKDIFGLIAKKSW